MARRSRRRFLQGSLAGLTAALAGCGMPGEDEDGGEEGGDGGEGGEDEDRSAPALGPDG